MDKILSMHSEKDTTLEVDTASLNSKEIVKIMDEYFQNKKKHTSSFLFFSTNNKYPPLLHTPPSCL
jgi:hypothetical protein